MRCPDRRTSVFVGIDRAVMSRIFASGVMEELSSADAKLALPGNQFPVSDRPGYLDRRQHRPRRPGGADAIQGDASRRSGGDFWAHAASILAPPRHPRPPDYTRRL